MLLANKCQNHLYKQRKTNHLSLLKGHVRPDLLNSWSIFTYNSSTRHSRSGHGRHHNGHAAKKCEEREQGQVLEQKYVL